MKRAAPSEEPVELSSGDDLSSDSDDEAGNGKGENSFRLPMSSKSAAPAKGALIRRAEMYQEYMKHIPIPDHCSSLIPSTSWLGLGRSVKQLYEQPLHYLTNILLRQWDQQRVGSDNEHQPLDAIIHPMKAQALIWATEEVHRLTTSSDHLEKLWAKDPIALSRHGYRGGPSILTVAPPKVEPNWTWSTGKDRNEKEVLTESFEERERTRAAVTEGEKLIGVMNPQPRQTEKEKDAASFSQKEKRKRDRGQASRGKNYVEEEKRLLRGSGVYSGFDT
uniref:Uncharacterized protein n=1 Tax=Aegilops tauschii TaxID=37682 RepID=N1QZK6_AEGTA